MREYIPGTQARRDRLFQQILAKEVGNADGLAFVEWEDGSVTLRPVIWESDISALIDPESEDMWFARGRGGDPKDFQGLQVWYVYAGNAGVISTEACLLADKERYDDVVDVGDGDEMPDELFELGLQDPNGGRTHEQLDGSVAMDEPGPAPAQAGQRVEADGGAAVPAQGAVYDLRPPEGYDGVAIDIRDPDDFDPWPVTREDAKAAAEWYERSADNTTDTWMKGFIVGIGVTVVLAAIFLGGPWLAGVLTGSGAGNPGSNITGVLPAFAFAGRSLVDRVKGVLG